MILIYSGMRQLFGSQRACAEVIVRSTDMALNECAIENFIQKRRKEARDEADFQWLDPISEEERLSGKILTFIRH